MLQISGVRIKDGQIGQAILFRHHSHPIEAQHGERDGRLHRFGDDDRHKGLFCSEYLPTKQFHHRAPTNPYRDRGQWWSCPVIVQPVPIAHQMSVWGAPIPRPPVR